MQTKSPTYFHCLLHSTNGPDLLLGFAFISSRHCGPWGLPDLLQKKTLPPGLGTSGFLSWEDFDPPALALKSNLSFDTHSKPPSSMNGVDASVLKT